MGRLATSYEDSHTLFLPPFFSHSTSSRFFLLSLLSLSLSPLLLPPPLSPLSLTPPLYPLSPLSFLSLLLSLPLSSSSLPPSLPSFLPSSLLPSLPPFLPHSLTPPFPSLSLPHPSASRFEGSLNVDLNEITMNLVPFPRLHYLVSAISPLYASRDVSLPPRK